MARDFAIKLSENPVLDSTGMFFEDYTLAFEDWRHGTREIGGNWSAEGVAPEKGRGHGPYGMTEEEMLTFFAENLGKRMQVTSGGMTWWDGQVVFLELTYRGQVWVRSMLEMANRIKVLYSRLGPQLLTNGDVEAGAWGSVGTPSTIETTTVWFARGTTAMHCVTDAGGEGMEIEAGVGISAGRAYQASVVVNVVSGTWALQVLDNATGDVLAARGTDGDAGRTWLQVQIPDTNTFTSVDLVLITDDAAAECYADGAVLRLAAVPADTGWVSDADSIKEWGKIELVLVAGEMTDTEADNLVATELADRAWPEMKPQEQGSTFVPEEMPPAQLVVGLKGLVWSLTWVNILTDATDQASDHIIALVDESELFSSGEAMIRTNAAEVLIEADAPITLWRGIEKVVASGDGTGARWMAGVYPGLEFRYEERPTDVEYRFSGGTMYYYAGGEADPLEFRPGWVLFADMPVEPTPAGLTSAKDPRHAFLTETWFVAEGDHMRLEWTREVLD